jgi:uncharacterized membrane protein
MRSPLDWVIRSFLKGLLLVVPVTVTAFVIYFVFTKIDGLLNLKIPGLGFLTTVAFIVGIGALGSNILVSRFIVALERGLTRLPLVKLVYFSLKDLIGAFVGEKKSFRLPVLVSLLPESDSKVLGFVTADPLDIPGTSDHVAVYLPQSYNFAGSLVLVPRDRITYLPPEESAKWLAFIVSGGVTRVRHGVIGGEDFSTSEFPKT